MQLFWFGMVGAGAAGLHLGLVWYLVAQFALPPLLANVLGFCAAFVLSFVGHHQRTFAAHATPVRHALPRFMAVAVLGFCCNEVLYALLLHLGMEYRIALFLVLVAVAGMTWLLSRYWAFRRHELGEIAEP